MAEALNNEYIKLKYRLYYEEGTNEGKQHFLKVVTKVVYNKNDHTL